MNKEIREMTDAERINHLRSASIARGMSSKSTGKLLSVIENKNMRYEMLMNAFVAKEQSATNAKKNKNGRH